VSEDEVIYQTDDLTITRYGDGLRIAVTYEDGEAGEESYPEAATELTPQQVQELVQAIGRRLPAAEVRP